MKKIILFVLFYLVTLVTTGCNPCADADPSKTGSGAADILGVVTFPETESGGIYGFSTDGSVMNMIREDAAIYSAPRAGKMVYKTKISSGTQPETIVISNIDGSDAKTIFTDSQNNSNNVGYTILSPDGQYVLFFLEQDDPHEYFLWIVRSDGTGLRKVTMQSVPDVAPSFSPESRSFAYVTKDNYLQIQTVDGNNVGIAANDASINGDNLATISWSSQNKIAYCTQEIIDAQYNVITPSQIAIVNVDGSDRTTLSIAKECGQPSWSHDGSKLCFLTTDGNIYTASSDGSGVLNVIYRDGKALGFPSWSNDGSKILFTEQASAPEDDNFNGKLQYLDISDGSIHYVGSSVVWGFWKN